MLEPLLPPFTPSTDVVGTIALAADVKDGLVNEDLLVVEATFELVLDLSDFTVDSLVTDLTVAFVVG